MSVYAKEVHLRIDCTVLESLDDDCRIDQGLSALDDGSSMVGMS